jgi:hypothetical protein
MKRKTKNASVEKKIAAKISGTPTRTATPTPLTIFRIGIALVYGLTPEGPIAGFGANICHPSRERFSASGLTAARMRSSDTANAKPAPFSFAIFFSAS